MTISPTPLLSTQPQTLTLRDVEDKFGLQAASEDAAFFVEWQAELPALSEAERRQLDRVRTEFSYLGKYDMLEDLTKMVVISPLLSMAGFYRPPIHPVMERRVEMAWEAAPESEAEAVADAEPVAEAIASVQGRVDMMGFQQQLWVAVMESQARGGLEQAIAQLLACIYMHPNGERSAFGLVSNGDSFCFVKLAPALSSLERGPEPRSYEISAELSIHGQENELYQVLAVLKRFVALATV